MRLNITQCRSSKKSAAPGGLRRSTRITSCSSSSSLSSCSSQLLQQKLAYSSANLNPTGSHCFALLPVDGTLSALEVKRSESRGNRQRKGRANTKGSEKSVLPEDPVNELEPKHTRHRSPELETCDDDTDLCRQVSGRLFDASLSKQSFFKLEATNGAALTRESSFKSETFVEARVLSRTSSCTTIGRKRVVGLDDISQELDLSDCSCHYLSPDFPLSEFSPRKRFASPRTSSSCLDRSPSGSLRLSDLETPLQKSPDSPSTPTSCSIINPSIYEGDYGDSQLEELPFDLLLRIVCCLQHDDLKPVSLVCKRLMNAVSIAQQFHFSFTTPHREKKGKISQLLLCDEEQGGATFICPPTPDAPKHLPRPAEVRFQYLDTCPFAPRLFRQEDPPLTHARKTLKRKGTISHRVLFDEDALCQAVAQNSL